MDDLNQKIDKVRVFLNFINEKDTFDNLDDIRSISIHSIAQTTQSYLFSLFLSKELENIEYVKKKISQTINQEHLETINYIYDGFLKNAFFINLFLFVENHIRQIALHYEKSLKDININSITLTFKNLRDLNKITLFEGLDDKDEELFTFYCYVRNTMHNVGFQTQSDKYITIIDENSIFKFQKTEIKLIQNSPNNITFEELLILQEQVIKLILKMNSLIPKSDFLKHKFTDLGFNN
jgi:hypothetical protein